VWLTSIFCGLLLRSRLRSAWRNKFYDGSAMCDTAEELATHSYFCSYWSRYALRFRRLNPQLSDGADVGGNASTLIQSIGWNVFLDGILHQGVHEAHWMRLTDRHGMCSAVHAAMRALLLNLRRVLSCADVCAYDPTFVVTAEHLDDDMELLRRKLGISFSVPHENPSEHSSVQTAADVYTHEAIDRVVEAYKPDFEMFGYSMDPKCAKM
jgi:hypothetical protein